MKMARKLLAMAVVLAMVLGLTSTAVFADSNVSVVVDGVEVQFADQGPIMVDGRVLAPVRGVFTQMGFYPEWDSAARVATLSSDDIVVVIPVDGTHFYVNDEVIVPVVAQFMLNDRVMLPVAAIAEAVGGTAGWDPAARVVTVTTVAVEAPPVDDEDYDDVDEYYDDEDYDDEDYDDADYDDEDDEDYNGDEDYDDEDYNDYDDDDDYNDEDDEDADEEDEAPHALIGTWANDYGVVVFNADGTGTIIFDEEDSEEFTWYFSELYDNMLVLVHVYDNDEMSVYFVIDGDVLTLTYVNDPDDYIILVRQ